MSNLLALLLCFIFAFKGSVSAHAISAPCPMDYDGGSWDSLNEFAQAVGDCCNDAETAAKTGKLCKTDTPCGSSSASIISSFHAHIPSAQASHPTPALAALIATFDPSGIWRPPFIS